MAKSKFTVKGYVGDILGFTKLMPARDKWINSGEETVDGSDHIADLAKKLHPGPMLVQIVAIREEPDARTFRFQPLEGYQLPYFRAGQYLSVKYEIDGKWVTRAYGISSSPREADEENFLEITLKRKVGGYTSDYVWENWKVGTVVRCDGAFGNLYYQSVRDEDHIVAIAGGSGVTPFRAMAKDMLDTGRPMQMTILYGNRKRSDIIFKDDLDALAASSNGRLRVVHVLSEEEVEGYEHGFITGELIQKVLGDVSGKSFYIAGPQVLYGFAHQALDSIGVRASAVHDEAIGQSDDIRKHPAYPREMADKTFKLTLNYGVTSVDLTCNSSETLLVALERQGYAVDSHCRSGECGWCRSQMLAGEIWYRPENLGVRESDLIDGFVHPCSAYPMSDIVLKVHNQL